MDHNIFDIKWVGYQILSAQTSDTVFDNLDLSFRNAHVFFGASAIKVIVLQIKGMDPKRLQ